MSDTPTEHVVLADCKDDNNVLQSQMAYFNASSPRTRPQDTAIVPTSDGQLATWFCDFTSGQFTTSGVRFNATLGQKRSDGDYIGTYTFSFDTPIFLRSPQPLSLSRISKGSSLLTVADAGNGTNGYDHNNGGFRCWQQYEGLLYKQGKFACSQVLLCDHRAAPSPLPASSCSASGSGAADAGSQGLGRGAIIGIGVGCGVGGLIALAAILLIWRHFRQRRRRRAAELPAGAGEGEAKSATAYSNAQSVTPTTPNANYYQHYPQELETNGPAEVDGASPLGELYTPVNHLQHEMETPESRYYEHYDEQGNTLPPRT
ncbi:hypothetical protein PG995_014518 [Apiospora arundinis]